MDNGHFPHRKILGLEETGMGGNKAKVLALVVAACTAFTLTPVLPAEARGTQEGDFVYDGSELVEYTGPGGDVEIPEKTLTIYDYAFNTCRDLKSVTFNDKLQKIGQCAFRNCSSLTSVSFPRNLRELGHSSFEACTGLREVTFTGHTLTNTYQAFEYCNSLEKATFTDPQLTAIPDRIFEDAPALTTVVMPESVTAIGESAFDNCTSLEELTLPAAVTTLGRHAFFRCDYLRKLVFDNDQVNGIRVTDDAVDALPTDAADLTVYGYDGSGADLLVEKTNKKYGCNIKYKSLGSAIEKFVNPNDGYQYYWKARESDGEKVLYRGDDIVSNEFVSDGDYTYYCVEDGTIMKDRLTYHPDGEHIIYFDANGREVFNAFTHASRTIEGNATDAGEQYYFNVNGYMYVNTVTYDESGRNLYYVNPYGQLEHNGWFTFDANAGYGDSGEKWHFTGSRLGYANYDGTLLKNTSAFDYNGAPVYMQGNGEALY